MRLAVIAICVASTAHATPLAPAADERIVYGELAFDGAPSTTIGFVAGVPRAGERLTLAWWTDATWVAGDRDIEDNRLRVGAGIDAFRAGRVRVRGGLAAASRATANTGYRARAVSTELHLDASVVVRRWAFQLETALEQTWATYVEPSSTYRELVYANAEAGWHAMTARTTRVGLAAGVRLGDVELVARAGWQDTGTIEFLPAVYASLGLDYRF